MSRYWTSKYWFSLGSQSSTVLCCIVVNETIQYDTEYDTVPGYLLLLKAFDKVINC